MGREQAFVVLTMHGHRETLKVRSEDFKKYLKWLYYATYKKVVPGYVIQEVVELLEAKAIHEGSEEPVFKRVASQDNCIYLDIGDKGRSVICITPEEWHTVQNATVNFIRKDSQEALPFPLRGGSILDLKPFINLRNDDNFLIFVSYLIRALCPWGPYPILNLRGGPGTAKSTILQIAKKLVDPSFMPVRKLPENDRDIFISASNAWMLAYDNVSKCSEAASDTLCMLSTGGGFGTRVLFTNDEELFIKTLQPVAIAGITNLIAKGDLAERCLTLVLPKIVKHRPEKDLWVKFRAVYPAILGSLCDVLVCALRNISSVKSDELPRMADYMEWILAAKEALPPSPRGFLDIYRENQNALVEVALETDPMAQAVLSLMENRTVWKGTAAEALRDLGKQPVVSDKTRLPSWPKAPNKLREHLQNVEPYLLNHGITIEFDLRENQGARKLRFEKAAQAVSPEVSTDSAEPKASDAENELYQSVFDMEMLRSIQDKLDSSPPPEKEPEIEEEGLYQSVFDSDDHDKPL